MVLTEQKLAVAPCSAPIDSTATAQNMETIYKGWISVLHVLIFHHSVLSKATEQVLNFTIFDFIGKEYRLKHGFT